MEHKFPRAWQEHGALLYDTRKEEGKVRIFASMPKNIVGLDILKDWIVELEDAYNKLHKETFEGETR